MLTAKVLTPSFTVFLLAAGAAHAAEPLPLATSVGAWKGLDPKHVNPKSGLYFGHSKEQVASMTANMIRFLEQLRKSTPMMSQPRGFDYTAYGTICEYNCPKGQPIAAEASFLVHEYAIQPNGKPRRVDEGPSFKFHFNDIRRLLTNGGMDDSDEIYHVEPQIVEHIGGHPVYRGGLMLLTKRDRPVFNYVPAERGLGDQVKNLETIVANMRRQMATESNPKQLAYLERITKRDQDKIDQHKARFAAMTPAQRQAPYQDVSGQRYVTINRDFYDKSLPPSALQMVVVDMYKYGARSPFRNTTSQHTVDAVDVLQKQLDPQQMLNMLE